MIPFWLSSGLQAIVGRLPVAPDGSTEKLDHGQRWKVTLRPPEGVSFAFVDLKPILDVFDEITTATIQCGPTGTVIKGYYADHWLDVHIFWHPLQNPPVV